MVFASLHDRLLYRGCSKAVFSRPLILSLGLRDHGAVSRRPNSLNFHDLDSLIWALYSFLVHGFVQNLQDSSFFLFKHKFLDSDISLALSFSICAGNLEGSIKSGGLEQDLVGRILTQLTYLSSIDVDVLFSGVDSIATVSEMVQHPISGEC